MHNPEDLSEEDRKRVESVLHSAHNSTERQPFKPWKLLFYLWIVVTVLGLIAYGLGDLAEQV